jgi:hypothetical protein
MIGNPRCRVTHHGREEGFPRFINKKSRNTPMKINLSFSNMEPALALIAGILILVMPQLLNLIVAIYLIVIGALGLTSRL